MKNLRQKIILTVVAIFILLMVSNWQLIGYGWSMAKGQFEILWNAKPLEHFKNQADFPDSLKQKINLIEDVKIFAEKEFGFKASDQYTKMYDQENKPSMWVVSAALPYSLENLSWNYPLLGKMDYKGFFQEEKARKLLRTLQKEGYDTRLRNASAWSTLGWFNDPILSNILKYSDARLAELIFHELTHDEVFIKDSLEFNENLATFLGRKFAIYYLEKKQNEEELDQYLNQLADKQKLNQYIHSQLPKFDSLYVSIEEFSTTKKEQLKFDFFNEFKEELKQLNFNQKNYPKFIIENAQLNNAHLLSFRRYNGLQARLEEELIKFQGNPVMMLDYYKKNFNSL